MAAKTLVFVFAHAVILQCISSQYIDAPCNSATSLAWGAAPYTASAPIASSWVAAPMAALPNAAEFGPGFSPANLVASNGGGLAITSTSPIAPTGVAMTSENTFGGSLGVSGALPYLGAVALEGAVATGGAGGVSYHCGDGNVAMVTEDITAANFNSAYGYSPATLTETGYGPAVPPELSYGYAAPMRYERGIAAPAFKSCGRV